jgi:cyclopropane fatty-acyl-phospholipid synthase-like methyltransferase
MDKSMSSAKGKEISSMARGGDYAHAGETEAIALVFDHLGKDPSRHLLDVGCGRGGTAQYLYERGFGFVHGFDTDEASIAYARSRYAPLDFRCLDARRCANHYDGVFEIIYLFNVLYLFGRRDQLRCLRQLRRLADEASLLVLFDYTARTPNGDTGSTYRSNWHPIDLAGFPAMSEAAGWGIEDFADLTDRFNTWYAAMLEKLHAKYDAIVEIAGEEWFEAARRIYQSHLDGIESGRLGGAVYYLRLR